jgi:type II secretory pathway pseudopilin PulG
MIRQQRAQAQQQAAQLQAAEQASATAKNLGATPTTGGNAASDVMGMFAQGLGQ